MKYFQNQIMTSLLLIGMAAQFAYAGVTMQWVQTEDPEGNIPAGYLSWDLMATVTTNLAYQEMIIDTGVLGDIYQNDFNFNLTEPNPGLFDFDPALEFDTYVTFGAWSFPTPTSIIGGAVDILQGSAALTFNTQNLNISWALGGGFYSGPGTFKVSQVTLKDTAEGTWQVMGRQIGPIEDAEIFEGSIVDGVPLSEPALLEGDANRDGLVSAGDYASVQANFGNVLPTAVPVSLHRKFL